MTYYVQMISIQSDSSEKLFNDFIHEIPPCLAFIEENSSIDTVNFYGKFVIIYQRRIPPKKFWILKFFGLRQNLTRQLQAQIKKGCSKFWICHTFKNFLNCGNNSTFKKRWADNV